jgi:hypothetical protein
MPGGFRIATSIDARSEAMDFTAFNASHRSGISAGAAKAIEGDRASFHVKHLACSAL